MIRLRHALLAAALAVAPAAHAQATIPLSCGIEGCGPLLTETKYLGRAAYRFSDGKTEAIVVPSLGRVMSYGLVGGPNQLWNNAGAKADPKKPREWINWGGDKTWPAPQDSWVLFQPSGGWPPPFEIDGAPHLAQVLSGGRVRTVSPIHRASGTRTTRLFSLNDKGEFVIEQGIEKISGGPLQLSIWSVTQIPHPDAIYIRSRAGSTYKDGFHWIGRDADKSYNVSAPGENLVRAEPTNNGSYKFGVDSPVVALASVKGDVAFVQKSARPEGQYPDGALNAGFPVEIYNNPAPNAYVELEVLSPLKPYFASKDGKSVGTRYAHTVRWSLHKVGEDPDAMQDAVEKLLDAK